MGVIFGSVVLLLVSLGAQVAISAIEEFIYAFFPGLDVLFNGLLFSRLVSSAALFAAIYLLFLTLTPSQYQTRCYPKWPGALFVTSWWVLLILALPVILRTFFAYDLTYGSLAGVMIALFFFWLVGLGVVVGAALNAALAVPPEEQELTDGGVENVRTESLDESE
jgi:membrane protein